MSQKTRFTQSALAVAVALVSTQAWSAGFQLNEFSASGLGRAYSGEGAIADDAGNASRNPALIMMFDRPTMSAGAVFVDPGVNVSGTSPTGKSLKADNIAPTAWVPNFHFVAPINDQFGWGASITSNYGLATEYNDDYAAGSMGGKTDLTTANFNLSGAYRLDSNWSFGLGFDAVYAKAKIERYAGDLGQIVAGSGALPPALAGQVAKIPADTQIAHLNGNAWGFGWNAGILYELDKNNRYGLTYRSEVKIDFDGNYRSSLPAAYNQILGNFGLPAGTSGQTLFYKEEGFKDAYRLALGTTYYYDDNWTFRTGIAFDDSPVPANNRSISIPDQDRLWLSAGTTYAFNKDASVDVGVSYMHGQHVEIKEGPYTFRSEGTAWLYGANFNYRF